MKAAELGDGSDERGEGSVRKGEDAAAAAGLGSSLEGIGSLTLRDRGLVGGVLAPPRCAIQYAG
jgi:hypothetical protein